MLNRRVSPSLLISVLLLLFSKAVVGQTLDDEAFTFGVVPQQASEKLARQWIPFISVLSEQTGLKIEFGTAPSVPEFEKRLAQGLYDFVYMNPYHFTVFNESPGYVAIARQRDHVIHGIIVVSSSLEIESLEELAGMDLAFPAPCAFSTKLSRAFLDEAAPGYTATFVNSHDSVYRVVAEGIFAGGGGIVRTLNEVSSDLQSELEVLWLSPGYTGHAFAAHPRVPEAIRDRVQRGLIEMDSTESGAQAIRELGMNGFMKAVDSDWDDVRALGIDK